MFEEPGARLVGFEQHLPPGIYPGPESGAAVDTVLVAGRPVVRGHKLITIDEAALAAEAAEISPGFRKEVEAQIRRTADLVAPLLEGNRAAWKTPLGIARYVGGPKDS